MHVCRNRIGMADCRGESDPLKAVIGNATESLETDCELDTPPVMRKLVDFVDNHELNRFQMTLH